MKQKLDYITHKLEFFDKILNREYFYISDGEIDRNKFLSFFTSLLEFNAPHQFKITLPHKSSKILILSFKGGCSRKCIFCSPHIAKIPFKKNNLKLLNKRLENIRRKNKKLKKLYLVSHEPLLHPQIIGILEMASKYFKEILTFGCAKILSNNSFVNALKNTNLTCLQIPLYSTVPEIHDFIVGIKGDFSETLKAIENLRRTKIKIYTHSILLKHNIHHLIKDEKFIKNKLSLPFTVSPLKKRKTGKNYTKFQPSFSEIFHYLKGIDSMVGFPLCVTKKVQKRVLIKNKELSDVLKVYLFGHIAEDKHFKIKRCKMCKLSAYCNGFVDTSQVSNI